MENELKELSKYKVYMKKAPCRVSSMCKEKELEGKMKISQR